MRSCPASGLMKKIVRVERKTVLGLAALLALAAWSGSNQKIPAILVPINPEQNAIANPDVLGLVFDKLADLAKSKQGQVAILHIGDSHVEAGYFPGIVRAGLQQRFGDAGRGLIKPTIVGVYPKKWFRSVEVRQDVKALRLWAGIKEAEPGRGFNALAVYHEKGNEYLNFEVLDEAGQVIGKVQSTRPLDWPGAQGVQVSIVELPGVYRSVILRTAKDPKMNTQRFAQLYGVSLETGESGVVYHSYGLIGANCDSLSRSPFFQKQLERIQPDLVIVSLGTNDASTPYFKKEDYTARLDALIQKIRDACPHAAILLTTAPDSYYPRQRRRTANPNPNMGTEREALLELAFKRHCAVWDLFAIMGGAGSITTWRDSALANLDNIHFTKDGYEQLGRLLLEALTKGYDSHAAARSR